MAGSFVVITHTTLVGSVVPIEIRGRYITSRQKVFTVVSLLAGLGISYMLDYIPGFLGYTLVFAIGGVAGIIDILLYTGVNFSMIPGKPEGFSLFKGIKSFFTTKKTRDYLLFWTIWVFAINISAPFVNKYIIDVLMLSYITIFVFGQIASQVMIILVVSRWGVFLDRYGSVPMLMIAITFSSVLHAVWLFAIPGSIWPLFITNLIGGVFWCAHDAGMANMQFSHTPSGERPTALAVYSIFTAVAAAVALIIGGALLEALSPVMESANLTFAGTPFDHYKVLIVIGIVLRFTAIAVFLPKVWNEKEMTLREAYSKAYSDAKFKFDYVVSRLRFRRFK